MAFSRTTSVLAFLLSVCIAESLLVDVSAAQAQQQEQKADNPVLTTQHYLRGDTTGAMTQGTPLTEDMTEESFDSFGTMDLNDYGGKPADPNCSRKPCPKP